MIGRTQAGKPFQLLERHYLIKGYDFYEALDLVEEQIGPGQSTNLQKLQQNSKAR